MRAMGQRKTIWFAIVMSTFVYAIVVYSLSRSWPRPGPFGAAVQQQLVLGLYAAAVAVFFGALILSSRVAHHHQRFIVRISLFESCAILGLVIAMITRDWRLFVAPWALSLMGLMTSYPSDVE